MKLVLKPHEHILTAYAEPASGPGWSNTPIIAIIRDANDGKIRQEWIQPEDQTSEMWLLYRISTVAHEAMTGAVRTWATPKNRKKISAKKG